MSDALGATRSQAALAGGYRLGETLYYIGSSQTFPSGNKLVFGKQGEVMGPGAAPDEKTRIGMMFPGNKGKVNCVLATLSRTPPVRRVSPPPPNAIAKAGLI